MAAKTNKRIVTFYGTSGHGKGLVDVISSFGVKAPICRAVLTEDFSYQNTQDIYDYLTQFFQNDSKKHYLIEKNEIEEEKEKTQGSYGIQKCRYLYMISYFPDGSIQTKQHLCSCAECVVGNFIDCLSNPGTQIFSGDSLKDSDSGSDTEESDTEEAYNEISRTEQELRATCVTDIVVPNSFIALFSPPESFELFYLCHAFSVETASEMVIDQYNHIIQQGERYIVCKYLEKLNKKMWAYVLQKPSKNSLCFTSTSFVSSCNA